MKIKNFVHILAVSLALALYAAWVSSSAENLEGTDIPLLTLADAQALWQQPSAIFLDVRSSIDYEFGHIQGAVNLPLEDFAKGYPDLKPRLERADAIVVYCKSDACGNRYWSAL